MNLTVGRMSHGYRLATALSLQDASELDSPLSYHVDCGNSTSFNVQAGKLSKDGVDVFHLTQGGQLAGAPAGSPVRKSEE